MSIILNDNLSIQAPKAADSRFGPYADVATALSSVITANRYQGLVVGITVSGSVVEYWFRDGTADANLILKVDSTANTASANTTFLQGALNTANANTIFLSGALATTNANTVFLQGGLNTANANTVYLQSYSKGAYDKANSSLQLSGTSQTVSSNVTIQGNLTVTGNVSYTGNVTSVQVTGNTGQFFGYAANGYNALYAGIPTGYFLEPQMVFQISSNFNGYSGLNMQNINSGANSSSDLFITSDNGTINDGFLDLGFASSTYNYPGYSLIGKNDGYLFATGNTITGGGNMIVGTGLNNDIIFATGGINTTNEVARFKDSVGLVIKNLPVTFADGTKQNTAGSSVANTIYLQGALNTANANTVFLSGALATTNANTVLLQGGLNTANANTIFLSGALITANANTIFTQGVDSTQNTWISSNSLYSQAAFALANLTAGGLVTANANTIFLSGGLAAANANTIFTQGVDSTQNTWISSNSLYSQAAFAQANLTAGGLVTANANTIYIQGGLNTANANTVFLSGVNSTQNTWISSNSLYSQAAFAQANLTSGGLNTANANTIFLSGALATTNANTIFTQGVDTTQNTWISSNSLYSQASFAQANLTAGGLVTANANNTLLFSYVNSANANIALLQGGLNTVNANTVFLQGGLNTANANTIFTQGVDTTQNTWISSNSLYAQAAFALANLTAGGLVTANANTIFLQGALNSANANTIYLQGALNSANANIVAVQALANTDYTTLTATSGTYGSSTLVPVITLASNGRVTSITTTTITGGGGGSGNANTTGWLANSIIFASSTGTLSNTNNLQFYTSNNALVVTGDIVSTGNVNVLNTFSALAISSSVNYLQVAGNTSGNSIFLSAQSPDANASILIKTKGSGTLDLATGSGIQARILDIGSDSTKPLQIYGAGTLAGLTSPTGQSLQFSTNQQPIDFFTFGRGSSRQFRVTGPASVINYLQVAGSLTGNTVAISSQGTDTDLAISLVPKGNAAVMITGNTVGYIPASNSIYVGNRVGFASNNISVVYQVYNANTNSLDTIFG